MVGSLKNLKLVIGADVSGVKKGLNDMNNEIGKSEKDWKKSFGNISAQMTKVGATLTGLGASITVPLGLAVKAAEEERAQIALLEGQLKNVGVAYGDVKESLEANITAMQRKTGIADSEQREALSKLLLVTNDYDQALQLLPTALDLAAAGNMDVATASQYLGRVMNGEVTVLSRYGITIDKTATSEEALAIIQERVAGTAAAAASPFAILKAEMGDVGETIGGMLLPILSELLKNYLMPLLAKIQEWVKEHPELAKNILIVVGAVGALATVLGPLIMMFPALVAGIHALNTATGHWTLIIMGIVLLATLIITHWEEITLFFSGMWAEIKDNFKEGVNFLIGLIEGWANFYIKAINFVLGALNKIQVTLPDWMPGALSGKTFGINIPLVPEISIPRLKLGGIVTGPTLAMLGDNPSRREAIVPLPGNGALGNVYNITVYPQGSIIAERDLAETIREELLHIKDRNYSTGL